MNQSESIEWSEGIRDRKGASVARRSTHRIASWIAVALLLAVLPGCAVKRPQFDELLWPEPPLTPRIKFVGLLRNQDDLGRRSGEIFAEALAGRKTVSDSIQRPMGLAASRDANRLYVSDYDQGRVLVFDLEARTMSPLGGEAHGFKRPFGIAVDDDNNIYVVDSAQRLARVFDASGTFLRNLAHEALERPTGIAVDSERKRIYIADSSWKGSQNHVVHAFNVDGTYLKAFGGLGSEEGKFLFPTYLTLDSQGNVYVTDTLNSRVQVLDPNGNHIRSFGEAGDRFGMFHKPKGVALDTLGNVYVVDSVWSNVQIFNAKGEVLLYFAGRGRIPGLLENPTGIVIDQSNRIYVADAFNERIAIYQLINTEAEDSFASQLPE